MANSVRVPAIFSAVDNFSSVVRRMTTGVSNFSTATTSAVQRVNTRVNKLWSGLDNLSQIALGGGISAGFLVAGKAVMEYEDALASLEAVTGKSSNLFKGQIESIATRTKKSAIDVTKSFEIIGSAMSQYLNNPKALGQITEAGIIFSKASRMELEPSLEVLTSVLNQFGFGAEKASWAVNKLTAGEIVGSVKTAKLSEQLSKFGAVADNVNATLPESIALIQALGLKFTGPMQSEIGHAAKNLLLIMDGSTVASKSATAMFQKHGVSTKILTDRSLSLGARLRELSKVQKDGAAMVEIFGKENATAGAAIFQNLGTYEKYLKKIEETNEADKQASVNSNTLSNAITEIKNSFINAIVSGDKNNNTLSKLKDTAKFLANNMGTILTVTKNLIIGFVAFKAIVITTTALTWLYNASLGVMAVISGTGAMALRGNAVALGAYKVAAAIATGAQWLLNAAMSANPIGLVIVAIAALIALVTVAVMKFDSWGAALLLFLGPVGMVVSAFKLFYDQWESIKKAFTTDGIIGGIKRIGIVLLDVVLKPLQQVLGFLKDMPLIGGMATKGFDKINSFRNQLDLVAPGEKKLLESPQTKQVKATANASINGAIDINVAAKQGSQADVSNRKGLGIPVNVTSTQGAF